MYEKKRVEKRERPHNTPMASSDPPDHTNERPLG